jgi:hypothetical protein
MADAHAGTRTLDRLVADVASRMASGASLTEVEDAVIDPSDLDGDRKAALWLYAWSCQARKRHRCEALEAF